MCNVDGTELLTFYKPGNILNQKEKKQVSGNTIAERVKLMTAACKIITIFQQNAMAIPRNNHASIKMEISLTCIWIYEKRKQFRGVTAAEKDANFRFWCKRFLEYSLLCHYS